MQQSSNLNCRGHYHVRKNREHKVQDFKNGKFTAQPSPFDHHRAVVGKSNLIDSEWALGVELHGEHIIMWKWRMETHKKICKIKLPDQIAIVFKLVSHLSISHSLFQLSTVCTSCRYSYKATSATARGYYLSYREILQSITECISLKKKSIIPPPLTGC